MTDVIEQNISTTTENSTKNPEKVKAKSNKSKRSNAYKRFLRENNETQDSSTMKLPRIQEVEESVLTCIIGQNEPVRQIITAIYKAIVFKSIKTNLLIIGDSGTGKTETIRQILKVLNLPYTIEDATKYTQEGYYGADVEEMIYNLFENANQDIERAQNGVIVIDEIDKKAGKGFSDERDVSGREVLNSLLKIIEGTKISIDIDKEPYIADFDTSNLIVIFLGAYSGLEEIRKKRLNTSKAGFNLNKDTKPKQDTKLLKQDLIRYGLPEEFVGRISTIVEMNKLTKQDLASILRNSKLSIFRAYQRELRERGISLYYSGRLFERIAEKSLLTDTGARELNNTVNYIFDRIIYEVLSNPDKYPKRKHITKYKQCRLSLDIVNNNTRYTIT